MAKGDFYTLRSAIIFILLIFISILSSPANGLAAGEDPTVAEYFKQKSSSEVDGNKEEMNQISDSASADVTFFDFFKMILALAFVLGLIYFLLRFVKSKNRFISGSKYLENLGGTSLGQNRSVQLIKAGNRILILGVSDSVHLLKEIDDPNEIEQIMKDNEEKAQINVQESLRNVWNLNRKMSKKESTFKEELQSLLQERNEQMKLFSKKGNKHHE